MGTNITPLEKLKEQLEAEPCLGAMQLLSEIFYQLGQYLQAAETSRRGLAIYPDNLELRLFLGQALAAQNQWGEAEEVLQPLLAKICSIKELFHTLEQALEQRQEHRQALRMKTIYRLLSQLEGKAKDSSAVILKTIKMLELWQQTLTTTIMKGSGELCIPRQTFAKVSKSS